MKKHIKETKVKILESLVNLAKCELMSNTSFEDMFDADTCSDVIKCDTYRGFEKEGKYLRGGRMTENIITLEN